MKRAFLLALGMGIAHAAWAWDPVGHMLVNQIAYDRLTPLAKMRVDQSIDAFNRKHHTGYTPVMVSCWMDDIRGKTKEYNDWHYIELPYTLEGTPFPTGGKPNVVFGIDLCIDIINGRQTYPGIDKDQALVMLTHLVGDVHQPLHATSHGDLGGNKVKITNLEDPIVAATPDRANLHYFWDTSFRRVFEDGKAKESYLEPPYLYDQPIPGHRQALPLVKEQAALLLKAHPPAADLPQGDAHSWAAESHALGFTLGYQQLPGGDSANPATLDQAYTDNARNCAQQRVVTAGIRLANLLNQLYH